MNNQRILHPLAGLFVLFTSLITYVLCLEPSVSWWDCGEFISSAYRLEVGHPPGAPLFMLLGRFFTFFASGPEHVAKMVNLIRLPFNSGLVVFVVVVVVCLGWGIRETHRNDTESQGSIRNGNWISGIGFIDEARLGPQEALPDHERNNKSRNKYFLLPLLLGLTGATYQFKRSPKDFWVVLGVRALRVEVPAFAGMTGRGASRIGVPAFAGMTSALALGIPILMVVQNWDDHDRSNRYIARDFAYNYLNSCAPNDILFTSGDNDTFPLWYAQEVEGIRADVRVICLPYLAADWYIDQMKRKAWLSDPVPLQGGGSMNYIPTRKFRLAVDRQKVLANGTVPPEDAGLIVPEIIWELRRSSLYKNDLMILDLIAHNNWERPIYFTSMGHENILGLQQYFRLEGFAYRLVPIRETDESGLTGSISTGILYDRLMNTFRWGNINDKSVFIDSNTFRTTLILRLRQRFADLADALIAEGKPDSARAVVDRVTELLPSENFPNDVLTAGLAEMYYKIGATDKGNTLLRGYLKDIDQDLRYIISVEKKFGAMMSDDAQRNVTLLGEIRRMAETYNQVGLVQEINKLIEQLGIKAT
ncbi:MAG: DUF2723 domain-containing protein [Porphyromonadaceae bacterium]|nr:MAG: DUF2723 domain-containing protein [Porphyromonadaceae bacterium]